MNIFTFDIETAPMVNYNWGIWQQNVSIGQIIEPTYVMSWAGKFLGERGTEYHDFHGGKTQMLERLHTCLSDADVVVGWNSDSFDIKHVNREFVVAGMPPVRPFAKVDLMKVVKKHFKFPSNKMDYVASQLLDFKKLETGGFSLWPEFMNGDAKACKTMRKYNVQDVKVTEALYKKLLPWINGHPPVAPLPAFALRDEVTDYQCPNCGSTHVHLGRPRRTRCFAIRQVNCGDCGTWFDGARRKIQ